MNHPFPIANKIYDGLRSALRSVVLTAIVALGAGVYAAAESAPSPDARAQNAIHLLDYVGTDYSGAVSGEGKIVNQTEYEEQVEFAEKIAEQIDALPHQPPKPELIAQSNALLDRKSVV